MWEFNQCLSYDKRLFAVDVAGSQAYALALSRTSPPILTAAEFTAIHSGLEAVKAEWESETFVIKPDDEDIHTANERRLSELIGNDIGGKLHTGRSRNDQVATDMRLWLMKEVEQDIEYLQGVIGILTVRAEDWIDHLAAGFTHLQVRYSLFGPTQKFGFSLSLVRPSHSVLNPFVSRTSYLLMPTLSLVILTDSETSFRTFKASPPFFFRKLMLLLLPCSRISTLPLGSGALAGNPFSVDRELLRSELGMASVSGNSMQVRCHNSRAFSFPCSLFFTTVGCRP